MFFQLFVFATMQSFFISIFITLSYFLFLFIQFYFYHFSWIPLLIISLCSSVLSFPCFECLSLALSTLVSFRFFTSFYIYFPTLRCFFPVVYNFSFHAFLSPFIHSLFLQSVFKSAITHFFSILFALRSH